MRPRSLHVRSLEEALAAYARERADGRPAPTFTVDSGVFAKFAEYARKSYTITAYRNGSPLLLRGVTLQFRPVDAPAPASDFRLNNY